MKRIEILHGIAWHLECLALAAAAIGNFRPPADGFQMRMYYSLYLTNLMSAIDMVIDIHGRSFQMALEESLKTSSFSGPAILGYIRELRNGVVHRGMDPTNGGVVIDGVARAMAPRIVKSRPTEKKPQGTSYTAPTDLLRDIFIHCEIAAKSVIADFLEPNFDEISAVQPQEMLNDALDTIDLVQHLPDWAKVMTKKHMKPERLVEVQAHQIKKLRELLKPHVGQRIE